jgi:hypothetical protein
MKRPNITPGPWANTSAIPFRVTCPIGNGVADCNVSTGKSEAEKAANAIACAAVPDLLAALEKLIPHVLHYQSMQHADSRAAKDVADARATLLKAGYTF